MHVQEKAEAPLVAAGVMPQGFADSWAVNVYHDGSEGIQSHYDDAGRFLRPITSLRLFSDCRLSFGTQLYGCDGLHQSIMCELQEKHAGMLQRMACGPVHPCRACVMSSP